MISGLPVAYYEVYVSHLRTMNPTDKPSQLKETLSSHIFFRTAEIPLRIDISLWILSTCVFSATLVGYLMGNRQLSGLRILSALCVFIFMGATIEELCVVFLPLSICSEMIVQAYLER